MNNEDILREFCQSHGINIIDTNKRAHKMTKMHTKYFQCNDDYNKVITESFAMETEQLYTVEVTESELQKIANFESQVFANMRTQGHYGIFEVLMEQKERERYLRDNYPAVKKAYEQYSLTLKLAESGEL